MDIDFSPITNSDIYNIDKEKLSTTGKKRSKQIWLLILMTVIPILWPFLIIWIIKYIQKSKNDNAKRVPAMKVFAEKNGYSFVDNTGKWLKIDTEPKIYNLPFNAVRVDNANEISGSILSYPFRYSMSSVFIKSGSRDSQFPYNLFTIDLPVVLPKVFINSKINNLKGLDAQAVNFNKAEDHELEGDFYQYYGVRIEKNEQIDMYTILTPEVMETLKRNDSFDVWLSGNQLTLITFADQARYFAGIPVVFENAFTLMREIDKIARALRS